MELVKLSPRTTKSWLKGISLKKLGDPVIAADTPVVVLPTHILESTNEQEKVRKKVKAIFQVASGETLSQKLRDELSIKKDQAMNAIRTGQVKALEDVKEIYITVVESFLEYIKSYGGGYPTEAARKERGSIFGGWDEIRWVRKDVTDLLEEAVETNNIRVIQAIYHTPIQLAVKAINFHDHLVFQEFSSIQAFNYSLSLEIENKKLKKFLIDKSWRSLKEISDYYINQKFDDPTTSEKELYSLKDFSVEIIQIFLNLLKQSYDWGDYQSFRTFRNVLVKMFDRLERIGIRSDTSDYRILLEQGNLSAEESERYKKIISRAKIIKELNNDLKLRKSETVFSIAAWILNKSISGDLKNEKDKKFWDLIKVSLPNTVEDLVEVYLSVSESGTRNFWSLDWWEMEGRGEGVGSFIEIGNKGEWLFVIRSLELIENLSPEAIVSTKIPISRSLATSISRADSPIKGKVSEIEKDNQKWLRLLSQESINNIPNFLKLMNRVVKEQEVQEEEELINEEIDQNKKLEFIEDFKKSFYDYSTVRKIFSLLKSSKVKGDSKKSIKLQGFNQLDEKAAFIKDWHVDYGDWGSTYGEGLAELENRAIIKEIVSRLSSSKTEKGKIASILKKAVNKLISSGHNPSVILSNLSSWEWRSLDPNEKLFKGKPPNPKEALQDIRTFIGVVEIESTSIPVFYENIDENNDSKMVVVTDLKKLAEFVQYIPNEKKPDFEQVDNFLISIIDLNKEGGSARKGLIKNKPNWLKEVSDQERFLKQKVIIKIFKKTEVVIHSERAAIKILLMNYDQ